MIRHVLPSPRMYYARVSLRLRTAIYFEVPPLVSTLSSTLCQVAHESARRKNARKAAEKLYVAVCVFTWEMGKGWILDETYEESEDPLSESSPSHSIYWYSCGVASRAAKTEDIR